ncbi:MAG: ABC transporter ATP-binding protein [Beijerinckiaceae bacterium]
MIALHDVAKHFAGTEAVKDFSLRIDKGEFCVLVGPSGCGKSTALRMISAMIVPDAGSIEVAGKDISRVSPVELRRGIGYVIQSVGLFPHWTIAENILAVPRLLNWPKARLKARLEEIVALIGIDTQLLARYPRHLSGGQQQRIGVARALAADPPIILMDEPFAALDPLSRGNLQDEIRRIHAQSGKTIVFVTHDMDEALRLATMIVVMRQGRIMQKGTPAEVVLAPAHQFVRDFLGGPEFSVQALDVLSVETRMRKGVEAKAPSIAATASLRQALNLMLAKKCSTLRVDDESGTPIGAVLIGDIIEHG